MLNFRARVNSSPRASRRKARGALPPAPSPARALPRAASDLPQVPAPQTVPSGVQVMPLPLDASCFALRATANLPVPRLHPSTPVIPTHPQCPLASAFPNLLHDTSDHPRTREESRASLPQFQNSLLMEPPTWIPPSPPSF